MALRPASRQLIVRFVGRKPRDIAEVREIMGKYGKIKNLRANSPENEEICVHYFTTAEATAAIGALNESVKDGLTLAVYHHPATLLVMVNNLPSALREHAISIARGELARISVQYMWIDVAVRKHAVYIKFSSLADAAKAVQQLQDISVRGWRWEIEFHAEDAYKATPKAFLPPDPMLSRAFTACVPISQPRSGSAISTPEYNAPTLAPAPFAPSTSSSSSVPLPAENSAQTSVHELAVSSSPNARHQATPVTATLPAKITELLSTDPNAMQPSPHLAAAALPATSRSDVKYQRSTGREKASEKPSSRRLEDKRSRKASLSPRRSPSTSPSQSSPTSSTSSSSPPSSRGSRSRSTSRSLSPPRRWRSRSSSTSRSRSPSPIRKHHKHHKRQHRHSLSSSQKKARTEKRERKEQTREKVRHRRNSSSRQYKQRSMSPSSDSSSASSSRSSSPPAASSRSATSTPAAAADTASKGDKSTAQCVECTEMMDHLRAEHRISEDEITKRLVTAWFKGTWQLLKSRY